MTEQNFEAMRRAMVASQLRTTGVSDARVVEAMGRVPRERFVPVERRSLAYAEALVPLADGRALNPPMTLGRLLTEARPRSTDRALLIGAATGYSAAVLAGLVGELVAVESDPELASQARANLEVTLVKLVEGPLASGDASGAPYDLILIDGAVECVPDSLAAQLAEGGRVAAVILDRGVTRLVIGRKAGGQLGLVDFADASAALLPGFDAPRAFTF